MPSRLVSNLSLLLFVLLSYLSFAQTNGVKPPPKTNSVQSGQHALDLAKSGRCGEAVPLLKKTIAQTSDKDLQRDAGMAGLRCAMVNNQFDSAEEFLRRLYREFPNDPEVLYTAVHTYSDLATHASQELAMRAPNSAPAHELNAESLEMQGKWDQAAKEYGKVLQQNPRMPGIHFRIGRLLLSEPSPPADAADQAKKEFQQELKIDPSNAGAEYVLGELARQSQQWDDAVQHFTRAAKLDSSFGDAYVGWGAALISTKKFSDAIAPLEIAVKLEPENPAVHYNLAIAYTRTGRKQEGEREFALHRQMVDKNPPAQGETQPQAQPASTPQ
ncbi:MAG TPA: tetratricopeptide repeat protein [Terriglobales bacterium]|nr:tetratricopeptide repeat protein [Terriglobales bacterium]